MFRNWGFWKTHCRNEILALLTFKAFKNPFEAPQKNCENKKLIFTLIQRSKLHEAERVKDVALQC